MFCVHRLIHFRRISLAAVLAKSHYDSLGITPHATQTDIKAAYYKLSMLYHPDKNKGSSEASERFKDITSAYEVLGNFKLRKMYDKGILNPQGFHEGMEDVTVEDDAETKFYKSRINRSKAPPPTGRTPIYNFDEWSQAHYGSTFARREEAKEKLARKSERKVSVPHDVQKELIIYSIVTFLIVYVLISQITLEDHDVPVSEVPDKVKIK